MAERNTPWTTLPPTFTSNIADFVILLELCQSATPQTSIVWASSSSVYGLNTKVPFSEHDPTDLLARKPAKRLLTLATTSTASPSPPSGFSPSTALVEDLTWLISSSPEAPLFPSSKAEKSTGSSVSDLASILERLLKVKAKRNMMKLPRNGDVQGEKKVAA
ncbi:hypothetical protein HID58_063750 [Brassica napus]|uniref:Uncharacterized protein n=1 Tax=Brassica napus TaxID=3708 RepID=A0ABQ7Z7Z8_BRANA|nr:hypothetical protein HID58_063750 [Brassica napus]